MVRSTAVSRSKVSTRKKKPPPEVPAIIVDPKHNIHYEKGQFLGKGGFAHCYEFVNQNTREVLAGKVVPKLLLVKQGLQDKMAQEIRIHQKLCHVNVVKLFHHFEDRLNVYITLELCARRSLWELHSRRKAVTEPEARYFTSQVVKGVLYLHDLKIIHRDLKLGNIFLNDELHVKIGDFGLATTVGSVEKEKSLCGTPHYIAPEVLESMDYSFKVDVWAIGCILYILLFGKPPFESKTLENVYSRIKHNEYTIPENSGAAAANLIRQMLDPVPGRRPNAKQVHRDIFFKSGFMPTRLPVSCLTMVPKFRRDQASMEENVPPGGTVEIRSTRRRQASAGRVGLAPLPQSRVSGNTDCDKTQQLASEATFREPNDAYLSLLHQQVLAVLEKRIPDLDEAEAILDDYQSPEALPIFWISTWFDYSHKYGMGYHLCDNSVGVLFNDNSHIMLDEAGHELTYIEERNQEQYFHLTSGKIPQKLDKKITLLKSFRSYMNANLLKAGERPAEKNGDDLARLPTLRVWFKTPLAIVFHLSNGTVQINFFEDHVKMMMCPLMQSVTFIDEQKRMLTYKFSKLHVYGCPEKFLHRIKIAENMLQQLQKGTGVPTKGSIIG